MQPATWKKNPELQIMNSAFFFWEDQISLMPKFQIQVHDSDWLRF